MVIESLWNIIQMTPSTTAGTGTKKAEYELLSKCNTVAVTIDEDIYHIHRYVKKVVPPYHTSYVVKRSELRVLEVPYG